jgi:formylglycine-generating enzyme required for sulfatase activity
VRAGLLAAALALGCGSSAAPEAPPSCRDLPATCGPARNASCCDARAVPGGTFLRTYDAVTFTDAGFPATVSAFRLDTYPITVGRFRAFVEAGQGTRATPPAAGAGAHPRIPGSGWDPTWNEHLVEAGGLPTALKCGGESWTDAPGDNEDLPMNCIDWFESFAFCAWDGGRLPTEAEWNYAAAGGAEQRVYPWSSPPTSTAIDDSYAVYCGGTCKLLPVGSRSPKGDGRWGHAELAGTVWEWNLDWFEEPYVLPCADCAVVSPSSPGTLARCARGGGFKSLPQVILVASRVLGTPGERDSFFGARCARQ